MEIQIIAKHLDNIRKGQNLEVAQETLKVASPNVWGMVSDGMEIKFDPEESRNITVIYKYRGEHNKRKRREVVVTLRKYTITVDGISFPVDYKEAI